MTPPIATDRLVLREFIEDDWRRTLEYQRDSEYLRYYPWDSRDETDVKLLLGRFLGWRDERPRRKYQLAITLATTGELIGNVGIRSEHPGDLIAELGFELDRAHWGHGFATEAAAAMLDFVFDTLDLHRVTAHCVAENVASARVLQRVGMRAEGRLREAELFKGRWWDVVLFGILQADARRPGANRDAAAGSRLAPG